MCDGNIKKSVEELKRKFNEIRKVPFHKNLRNGSTGIGYTFEKLMGKDEDSSCNPDFKGIELKTKLGYSKNPMTLFNLTGKRNNSVSIYKYLLDNYGYFKNKKDNVKKLVGEVYVNSFSRINDNFIWKLKIDNKNNKLLLIISDNSFKNIDDSVYWDLNCISERLYTKLKYLAIIKGYPYNYNNETYYKYTNINFYKLKGFDEFMNSLEKGYIFVCINISYFIQDNIFQINNRHVFFSININYINELFEKI